MKQNKKICICVSTRPNIIKQYSLIKECIAQDIDFYTLSTGQHYSQNMFSSFFKELWLPIVNWNLWVNESDRVRRYELILKRCQRVFEEYRPDVVIVQWDTDSDCAVAIVAKFMWIKVAHNEAWIRSNSDIPEEYNRRIIDQISDYLFVPTQNDYDRLITEWQKWEIYLTGNTTCDCIKDQLTDFRYWKEKYIFMTLHRDTNVDDKHILENILRQVIALKKKTWFNVLFSMHPRTKKRIEEFRLERLLDDLTILEPIPYSTTIKHINWAEVILTDSGGIQEESCILKKKCITLRDSTERWYIGSILWDWDILEAYSQIEKVNKDKIVNIFNPMKYKCIAKEILSLII